MRPSNTPAALGIDPVPFARWPSARTGRGAVTGHALSRCFWKKRLFIFFAQGHSRYRWRGNLAPPCGHFHSVSSVTLVVKSAKNKGIIPKSCRHRPKILCTSCVATSHVAVCPPCCLPTSVPSVPIRLIHLVALREERSHRLTPMTSTPNFLSIGEPHHLEQVALRVRRESADDPLT
jgi:hypothetical protein